MKLWFYEKEADDKDYLYFNHSENNRTVPHFHNNMEIFFLEEGTQRVGINGEERILTQGDLAISSGYAVHYYENIGDTKAYILLAGGKYTARFNEEYGNSFTSFINCRPFYGELLALFKKFNAEYSGYNNLMRTAAVEYILGFLAARCKITTEKKASSDLMVGVLTYIAQNFKENITLESVAARFGYTKTYFSAVFNKYIGRHFREYLNSVRLEAVETECRVNETPVTKAAAMCGFESLNTYYRARNRSKS